MKRPTTAATCSPRLLLPILRLLDQDQRHPELRARVSGLATRESRISAHDARTLVDEAAALLGDPDVGLRAATFCQLGDFAALEWIAMSAPTWGEATRAACRYGRVLSDAADFRLEICDDRCHLILGSAAPMSRVVADYQVAAYALLIRAHKGELGDDVEVWFEHPRPANIAAYDAVFLENSVVFGAAFNGFNASAARLDEPLPTANPSLHDLLREHADRTLREIAPDQSLISQLCADILESMRNGRASAEASAGRLSMSRRTLTRQLSERGTSYKDLLNQTRYRTAIHYLRHGNQTVEDIAFLLGFSECGAFTRAFRRWSGMTPLDYRQNLPQGA